MTRTRTLLGIALFAGVAVLAVGALGSSAYAQSPVVAAAIADCTVGEQSDGYLGVNGTLSGEVRAAVEALNIKRRAA